MTSARCGDTIERHKRADPTVYVYRHYRTWPWIKSADRRCWYEEQCCCLAPLWPPRHQRCTLCWWPTWVSWFVVGHQLGVGSWFVGFTRSNAKRPASNGPRSFQRATRQCRARPTYCLWLTRDSVDRKEQRCSIPVFAPSGPISTAVMEPSEHIHIHTCFLVSTTPRSHSHM